MQIFIFVLDAVKFGKLKMFYIEFTMVLMLDGNSELGGHARSNLCFVISLRQLKSSGAVTKRNLFHPKGTFSFIRAQFFLSYHLR